MSKKARRERKRARRDAARIDGVEVDALERYLSERVVCDRCGLEQYRGMAKFPDLAAACQGPLGMSCDSVHARFAEEFLLDTENVTIS